MDTRHFFDAGELVSTIRQVIRPYTGVVCDVADFSLFVTTCLQVYLKHSGMPLISPQEFLTELGVPTDVASGVIQSINIHLGHFVTNTPIKEYDNNKYDFHITIDQHNTMVVYITRKPIVRSALERLSDDIAMARVTGDIEDIIYQRDFAKRFRHIAGLP